GHGELGVLAAADEGDEPAREQLPGGGDDDLSRLAAEVLRLAQLGEGSLQPLVGGARQRVLARIAENGDGDEIDLGVEDCSLKYVEFHVCSKLEENCTL